jgi:hypothetical protein
MCWVGDGHVKMEISRYLASRDRHMAVGECISGMYGMIRRACWYLPDYIPGYVMLV